MKETKKYFISVIGGLVAMCGWAITPPLDTTLNDFDPTVPVGYYIEEVASNTIARTVTLTNGVLRVGSEQINVASPTRTVISTNIVEGETIISTNVYNAVYEDGLVTSLEPYAKIKKISSIETNEVEGVTQVITNWTDVAYIDDIPPDSKKADKVIRLWDYVEDRMGLLLQRAQSQDTPFATWKWEGLYKGIEKIELKYSDGMWECIVDGTSQKIKGTEEAPVLKFGSLGHSFTMINDTRYAYVVYTNQLEEELTKSLEGVVAKTNLYNLSGKIEEQKLHTMDGIREVLLGIRSELNAIAGVKGIQLTFTNVGGATLVLNNAEMKIEGDSVEIDWGDGTAKEIKSLPASHTYAEDVGDVTVTVIGSIKAISGAAQRALGTYNPFASFSDGDNSRLMAISIDPIMGLEEIGEGAFYGYSNLREDLTFLPPTITTLGNNCFSKMAIKSVVGLPIGIKKIPSSCFEGCERLESLAGLPPTLEAIDSSGFEGCKMLQSLAGIPQSVSTLGFNAFKACISLSDITALYNTGIMNLPDSCFETTIVADIASLPPAITNIGNSAFKDTRLTDISTMPENLISIGEEAFSQNSSLSSVSLTNTELLVVEARAFANCPLLREVTFPSTVTTMTTDVFTSSGSGTEEDPLNIRFQDKMIQEGETSIASIKQEDGTSALYLGLNSNQNVSYIYGEDGYYVAGGNDTWEIVSTRTTFSLTNLDNGENEVALGQIEGEGTVNEARSMAYARHRTLTRAQQSNFLIDWGDGTINNSLSHTYTIDGNRDLEISILGKVTALSGVDGKPFISINGSVTNQYVTRISIGNGVPLKSLGKEMCLNNTALKTEEIIGLSAKVESLGEGCFEGCTEIKSLDFLTPTSVTKYPKRTFKNSGITRLGDSSPEVTDLGDECFAGCKNLRTLDGKLVSVSSLGIGAFRNCTAITTEGIRSLSKAPITEIPNECFKGCTGLTNLTEVLTNIETIGDRAFGECINVTEVELVSCKNIGANAFTGMGGNAPSKTTDDSLSYQILVSLPTKTYAEAISILGLRDSNSAYTGLDDRVARIVCKEGEMMYNDNTGHSRWEILCPALEIELKGVTNGTTFAVQTGGTIPYAEAALIWNWGDGHIEKWITSSPKTHTFKNRAPTNYVIKVKGMLKSISSAPAVGPYLYVEGGKENPYIVGFKIEDNSPIQRVGDYSFTKCPNLKNINTRALNESKRDTFFLRSSATIERFSRLISNWGGSEIEYGEGCFEESGLVGVANLPTVTSKLESRLFAECRQLEDITMLPSTIVDMGDAVFMGASKLRILLGYPLGMQYISSMAFANCTNLVSLIDLQDCPIKEVGAYAFYNTPALYELKGLPEGVVALQEGAFQKSGIETLEGLPTSIQTVGEYTFAECVNLSNITGLVLGEEDLPRFTFYNCSGLTDIVLPTNITSIGDYAFLGCESVTNAIIEKGISQIGLSSLVGCGLTATPYEDEDGNMVTCTIYFKGRSCAQIRDLWGSNFQNTLPTTKLVGWDGYIVHNGGQWVDNLDTIRIKIDVKADNVTTVITDMIPSNGENNIFVCWDEKDEASLLPLTQASTNIYANSGEYTIAIVGHIEQIGQAGQIKPIVANAQKLVEIQNITIGNNVGVSRLAGGCFEGNVWLKDLSFIKDLGIISIGERCFKDCTSLTNLVGIGAIECLGPQAFYGCTSLESIAELSNSTLDILNTGVFEGCETLSSLIGIPNQCKVISDRAFADCISLQNVKGLPNGTVELGEEAFAGCRNLATFDLRDSEISSLGIGCFRNCESLTSISNLSSRIEVLPQSCFEGCIGLVDMTYPTSITNVYASCFKDCSSLSSMRGYAVTQSQIEPSTFEGCALLYGDLVFPESIEKIGKKGFKDCVSLTDITNITAQIHSLEEGAFAGCTQVTNIVFPVTLTNISTTALSRVGESVPLASDNDQNKIKTTVYMTHLRVQEILEFPNFPFDAPLGTTKFVGRNGYLIYEDPYWISYIKCLEIEVEVNAGDYVRLYGCRVATNQAAIINWGDGNVSKFPYTIMGGANRYTKGGRKKITVYGNVTAIDWNADSAYPGFGVSTRDTMQYLKPATPTKIYVPEESTIERFTNCAFQGLTGIEEVIIDGLLFKEIGKRAFKGCNDFPIQITEEGEFVSLGASAFANSMISNLEWISPAVTNIGGSCFAYCPNLTTVGALFDSERTFGGAVFEYSSNIVEVTTGTLTNIPQRMFRYCTNLEKVMFSQSTVSVGEDAFYRAGRDCKGKRDPDGYEPYQILYQMPFLPCDLVTNKTFCADGIPFGTNPRYECADGIIVAKGQVPTKKWIVVKYGISCGVGEVKRGDKVTLQNGPTDASTFTAIRYGDEEETTNLPLFPHTHEYSAGNSNAVVSIQGEVKEISGTDATSWICVNNTPNSITTLGITAESKCESIGNYAFKNCVNLSYVEITANTITNIGESAFENCGISGALQIIYSPLQRIGARAFKGCNRITTFDFSTISLDGVEEEAFAQCTNVEQILLGNHPSTLASNALEGVGTNATWKTNRFGFAYKTEVKYAAQILASEIKGKNGFPWGAPTSTIFTTADGFVGYEEGQWKAFEYGLVYYFRKADHKTFIKGGIEKAIDITPLYYGEEVEVDWGDGTKTVKVLYATSRIKHTYNQVKYKGLEDEFRIVIKGRVSEVLPAQVTYKIKIGNMSAAQVSLKTNNFRNDNTLEEIEGIFKGDIIPYGAFHNCSKLRSVPMMEGDIIEVGDFAFKGCVALEDFDKVQFKGTLGTECFFGCTKLTSLAPFSTVMEIGKGCFAMCENLSNIDDYPNISYIPDSCFHGSPKITSLSFLTDRITTIDTWAFMGCTGIEGGFPKLEIEELGGFPFGNTKGSNKPWEDQQIEIAHIKRLKGAMPFGNWSNSEIYMAFPISTFEATNSGILVGGYGNPMYWPITFEAFCEKVTPSRSAFTYNQAPCVYSHLFKHIPEYGNLVLKDGVCGFYSDYQVPFNIDVKTEYTMDGRDDVNYGVFEMRRLRFRKEGIKVSLKGVPAGTEFELSDILCDKATGLMVDWGDGSSIIASRKLSGGSHTYETDGDYDVYITGMVTNIATASSRYPFLREKNELQNQYITKITIFDPVCLQSIGANAMAGLYNCREVEFADYVIPWEEITTTIAPTAFKDIGKNLEPMEIEGNAYKTKVNCVRGTVNWITGQKRGGAPESTCFIMQDGEVGANGTTTRYSSTFTFSLDTQKLEYPDESAIWLGKIEFQHGTQGWVQIGDGPIEPYVMGKDVGKGLYAEGTFTQRVKIYGQIKAIHSLLQVSSRQEKALKITAIDFGYQPGLVTLGERALILAKDVNASDMNIPKSIKELRRYCFSGNRKITDLTWLPTSLTRIGEGCFENCINLESLAGVGNTVLEWIGESAFEGCIKLKGTKEELTNKNGIFPSTLKGVNEKAFAGLEMGKGECYIGFQREFDADDFSLTWNRAFPKILPSIKPTVGARGRVRVGFLDGYLQEEVYESPGPHELQSKWVWVEE